MDIDFQNFKFLSDDHTRFESGEIIQANNKGAFRGIMIKSNDNKTFFVTIYNMIDHHPVWGNNIQMAEKRMQIIKETGTQTVLRGFGTDIMGEPMSDYGLTIHKNKNEVDMISLYMYDRSIEIRYKKSVKTNIDNEIQSTREDISKLKLFVQKWFNETPMELKTSICMSTDQMNNIGAKYYNQDDIHEAIKYYKKALDILPINDDAIKNLISCYEITNELHKINELKIKLDYLKSIGYST